MIRLTLTATIPDDKSIQSLEDGVPLLLQLLEGAGFSNVTVGVEHQITPTYTPPPPRKSRQLQNIEKQIAELTNTVNWIKNEVIGSVDDDTPTA